MISWFEKNYKISLVIAILIAGLMFAFSSLTFGGSVGEKGSPSLLPIIYHIISYFFLTLFLNFTIIRGKRKNYLILPIIISIFYAFTDEIHQYFVPGRNASFGDIFLDVIGVIFAYLLYIISLEYRKRYK